MAHDSYNRYGALILSVELILKCDVLFFQQVFELSVVQNDGKLAMIG